MGRQDFETETLLAVGGFFDDTHITHALRGEGFDASEDGTGWGTPLVPMAIHTTGAGFWKEGFGTLRGRMQDSHENLIAFSSKDYGADAGYIAPTLRAMGHDGSHANAGGQVAVAIQNATRGKSQNGIGICDDGSMYTLDHGSQHAVAAPITASYGKQVDSSDTSNGPPNILNDGMAVRRLTPKECSRLQGFPDSYLTVLIKGKSIADGPQYKMLGNSMAVPVMRWIAKRILMVDDFKRC